MGFELESEHFDYDEDDEVVNPGCLTFQREVKNKTGSIINLSFPSLPDEDDD